MTSLLPPSPLSSLAVKVPLDAYMMDFVFSEREDGGIFDNKNGMDYHIPVFGGVVREPPMHIVHIAVEMAPIAKVVTGNLINVPCNCFCLCVIGFESFFQLQMLFDSKSHFRNKFFIFLPPICCLGFLYHLN